MDHGYYKDRISGYLDNELPDYEREAIRQHLETCVECLDLYARLQQVNTLVERYSGLDGDEYWEAAAKKIEARIGIDEGGKVLDVRQERRFLLAWKLAGVAAAAAVLVFVAINQTDILQQEEKDSLPKQAPSAVTESPTPGAIPPEERPVGGATPDAVAGDQTEGTRTAPEVGAAGTVDKGREQAEPPSQVQEDRTAQKTRVEQQAAGEVQEGVSAESKQLDAVRPAPSEKLTIQKEAIVADKPSVQDAAKSEEAKEGAKSEVSAPEISAQSPLRAPSVAVPRLAPTESAGKPLTIQGIPKKEQDEGASNVKTDSVSVGQSSLADWQKRADSLESLWADLNSGHKQLVLPKARKGKSALSDIDLVERQLLEAKFNVGMLSVEGDKQTYDQAVSYFEQYLERPDARHRGAARNYLEQLRQKSSDSD